MVSKIFVIPVMLVMVCLAVGQKEAPGKPIDKANPCSRIRCHSDTPFCCPGTGQCVRDPKECKCKDGDCPDGTYCCPLTGQCVKSPKECRCRGNGHCPEGTYCCKPNPPSGFCLPIGEDCLKREEADDLS